MHVRLHARLPTRLSAHVCTHVFTHRPYERPKRENLHSTTMHLTNYAINKRSDNFVPEPVD